MNTDVAIVGAGPAGIFTALEMLRRGSRKKIVIIEKGKAIENRHCPKQKTKVCMNCKPNCHITTGFSGAGAVSDGSAVITVRYAGKSASCNVTVSTHKHIYSDWSYNGVSHWYECIDPNCPSINESIRDVSEHSFKWIIDKEATKKETGLKHEECVVCG